MIPADSYREQHVNCCGTCKHNIDVDGIMVYVCGFAENLHKESFYEDLKLEEDKYFCNGDRYFDQGEFTNKWLRGRWVHRSYICDEYEEEIA
ncbi:MAG: hypothetical protein ACRCZS_19125 [Chroococcidiopsis sp.]